MFHSAQVQLGAVKISQKNANIFTKSNTSRRLTIKLGSFSRGLSFKSIFQGESGSTKLSQKLVAIQQLPSHMSDHISPEASSRKKL